MQDNLDPKNYYAFNPAFDGRGHVPQPLPGGGGAPPEMQPPRTGA